MQDSHRELVRESPTTQKESIMLEASALPTDPKVMASDAEELLASDVNAVNVNALNSVNAILLLAQLNPTELDAVGKRRYNNDQAVLILAASDLVQDWRV
jgi:hypothetical protein